MHIYRIIFFPPVKFEATSDQGFEKALAAFDVSLQAIGRTYVDLYLIHWPGVQGRPRDDPGNGPIRRDSWRALEELYKAGDLGSGNYLELFFLYCQLMIVGKIKAIGVSNYTVKHLEEMMTYATIKPHVLQVLYYLQS